MALSFLFTLLLMPLALGQDKPSDAWVARLEKTDYDLKVQQQKQQRSLIDWEKNPSEWLDVQRWILERDLKDREPGWQVRLRLSRNPEKVGQVLSCIGRCHVYRGNAPARVRWQSWVLEGDELATAEGSYVWVLLLDGTLVRLSPLSSIGFLEINLAQDRVFHHARLNHGELYWLPRSGRLQRLSDAPETDTLFLPLMEFGANLSWFQRQLRLDRQEEFELASSPLPLAVREQQSALNRLIEGNNPQLQRYQHEALITTPTGSALALNRGLHWYFGGGENSFLKVVDGEESEEGVPTAGKVEFHFRGYRNDKTEEVPANKWMAISGDGRTLIPMRDWPSGLGLGELLVKRIPTILLARELALGRRLELFALSDEELMKQWGHRRWGEELSERRVFLLEYTRRLETTNLRSLARLAEKDESSVKPRPYDETYFRDALSSYHDSLKQRRSYQRESLRDMIPVHYYGQILKDARQH